jgi:hypothetical protein
MRTILRAGFCVAQRGLHYERSSPFTTNGAIIDQALSPSN